MSYTQDCSDGGKGASDVPETLDAPDGLSVLAVLDAPDGYAVLDGFDGLAVLDGHY